MKRPTFCSLVLLLSFTQGFSQNRQIDSLESFIKKASDTALVNSLNSLGKMYAIAGNPDTALKIGERAVAEAEKIKDPFNRKKCIANSYNLISNTYSDKGDYDKSLDYNFRALR